MAAFDRGGGKGTENAPFDPAERETKSENNFEIPSINLPKGGGAIRGMGEKFAANPVTGTGSTSVPIATSPGRAGFGPQLSLSYDSGAGNGTFGFGWNLPVSSITRKTDKGLPRYFDKVDSDVFILSGAEDLVPILEPDGRKYKDDTTEPDYIIHRYQPRLEGLFARIERWTKKTNGDVHWRSISKDNILTLYGKDASSRIADPEDSKRIFSWLICETRDDKGNAVLYKYKAEDGIGVDLGAVHERNRGDRGDPRRSANRYLKRIHYGNIKTLLVNGQRQIFADDLLAAAQWMFETVFDYGEHDIADPKPNDDGQWGYRGDAFSTYRSGFEVRTTRLCKRVLMFHHFPGETDVGENCLVRSTDFNYSHQRDHGNSRNPIYTFLQQASQTGYKKRENGLGYQKRSLPPLEFKYSQPIVQDSVEEVDPASLENLPIGVDGAAYQWTDLHGEGIPGILSEQAGNWWYKRNISPISNRPVEFAPLEHVSTKPNMALASATQFMDLAGNGQLDLVMLGGPTPGLYQHDKQEGWQSFKPFTSRLNRDMSDANLKFLDLNGDGHADVLITEDDKLVWHPSLAEAGFGPAQHVSRSIDEESGPRLVFADGTQSIFLADLSGDGLTDLVRIRNGEVCYWPNRGYCHFGAMISMDNAPQFDHPEQFDHGRIRLADIDGSGTTDIIYLHGDGVRLYFNQSGNAWSKQQVLSVFPHVDEIVNIATADLLGNGTACLIWSSPLLSHSRRPMRYVNLMGGQKPHLLIKTINNLGAETDIQYAPSTKFYLQDKYSGKPWITKLPFPVHVVEKVAVTDKWRGTSFATTYSYHHGYFDGIEREFRGFGRVEQIDVETYGEFAQGNANSPYVTADRRLYQPPVKTITWFHTGAAIERERVLTHFQQEYFQIPEGFIENTLPEPDLPSQKLRPEEWREAMRACKGLALRQEVYELDVDALDQGEHKRVRLFSTAYHNCNIQMLQAQADNQHAVFLVTESEAITYQYDLSLVDIEAIADPRISHTINLKIDVYGNVLQSVAAVYPRIGEHIHVGDALSNKTKSLITKVQNEMHVAYTEARFTDDVNVVAGLENYRLGLPCEVLNYELTGINPAGSHFTLKELRDLQLSDIHQVAGTLPSDLEYHETPNNDDFEKRIVEHARMLFFKNDLSGPLLFGDLDFLGLPYETYTLALTDDLLSAVIGDKLTPDMRADLNEPDKSGYFTHADTPGQYWIRSGIAGFAPDAADHFYLPEEYTDPFGNITTLVYDERDLFIATGTDSVENTVSVEKFDYRVLAAREIKDINNNRSAVVFDVLGLPAAMAVKGKNIAGRWQGDDLDNFDDILLHPPNADVVSFCTNTSQNNVQARQWLDNATVRFIYHFGETLDELGSLIWGDHMPGACTITREQHTGNLDVGEISPLQISLECTDGGGNVLMQKVQAEPNPENGQPRWIVNGLTILNNKGKPVKQYEPAFSDRFGCEMPQANGVTPVMYYDAPGRLIRTELPDGSFSRIEFSPWHVSSFDQNDTVLESQWYTDRGSPDPTGLEPTDPKQRAAWLTAAHANTPTQIFLDSLGRDVISVEDKGDEKYVTFTKLDAEGKPLWIRDPRGNLVMQYITPTMPNDQATDPLHDFSPCYDIAGSLLCQHSMDGGKSWMISDAAGQPFYAWDENENESGVLEQRRTHITYDALRRPLEQRLQIDDVATSVIERFAYGEGKPNDIVRNLRGQLFQHYDSSGLMAGQKFDFKGNLLEASRQFAVVSPDALIDWPANPPAAMLDEIYTQITSYDALDRMIVQDNWHIDGRASAIYTPLYNERGLLVSETLSVNGQATDAILNIAHDAKGQRSQIEFGNGTTTRYIYDTQTFRLLQMRTTKTSPGNSLPTAPSGLTNPNVLQNLYYTYDPVGNITEILDDAYEPVFFNNQQVDARNQYTYDALYRLITATGRESNTINASKADKLPEALERRFPINDQTLRNYTQHYTYDKVGNFEKMRHVAGFGGWTRTYQTASDSNRLMRTWLGGDEINAIIYQYDTHGSMLNLDRVPDDYRLRWDHNDMIHHIKLDEDGGEAFYNYGSDKQRSRKRIEHSGNRVEERLYLGGMERYRRWVAGLLLEEIEIHHLFDGDQRMLMVENVISTDSGLGVGALFRYQYSNHLGSVALELDAAGDIISYEEYHPYGTTAFSANNSEVATTKKRYRYTGMEKDDETWLNYHSARFYLPWLGGWGSVDPAGLVDGGNLYSYVNRNPISHRDSTGTQCDPTNQSCIEPSSADDPPGAFYGVSFAAGAAPNQPVLEAPSGTNFKSEAARGRASFRAANNMPTGTQAQHWTKEISARNTNIHPDVMNQNMSPLQSSGKATGRWSATSTGPATTLLVDPRGGQTRYFVEGGSTFGNEHKFADRHQIRAIEEQISRSNPNADPKAAKIDAGRQARWAMTGEPGPSPTQPRAPSTKPRGKATSRVFGGGAIVGLVGNTITDLHEGNNAEAARTAAEGTATIWALSKAPAAVPLVLAYATISAYDENVQKNAESSGTAVDSFLGFDEPTVAGGLVTAGAATGESIHKGVFKPIGTGIGEGSAVVYIRSRNFVKSRDWAKTIRPWRW